MTDAIIADIANPRAIRHPIKITAVKHANDVRTAKAQAKLQTSTYMAVKMHSMTGKNRIPTAIVPQTPIIQLKIRQRKVKVEQT